MLKIFSKITFLLFLFLSNSFGDVVNSVDVLGNKRLSKESIMMFGKININKDYTNEDLNLILKDLYSTDFFKQIDLSIKNKKLLIKVLENPIIEDI